MATKKELENQIENLKASMEMVADDSLKQDIQKEITQLEEELMTSNFDKEKSPKKIKPQVDGDMVAKILAAFNAFMQSNVGTALDSSSIRAMIADYFKQNKISLDELDKSVLDEIKKNQTVILNIPNFGLKFEVSSTIADIPNLYPIIDDVLAGNNVYLIGEAGGGKTFTAETVAKLLEREYSIINCSQYTSPTEIVGGQTIDGYKEGKLIDAWRNGKILILDEMPRLDPNTAGLFNDALAKSSKTKPPSDCKINSTNPKDAPFERNNNFGLIATGNIYPNTPPPPKYKANNQQDLSLLDRFSGSVYETYYDNKTDQRMSRFKFLYDMLVGNYYDYTQAIRDKTRLPEPKGLRTILKANNLDELAVVSYRTLVAFRVAFEYELVRELSKSQGVEVGNAQGKTLEIAFRSFLIAFPEQTKETILNITKFTPDFIKLKVQENINLILSGSQGFSDSLTPLVKSEAAPIYDKYKDMLVADFFVPQSITIK
jgi:cobaltochelatase CobS